MKQRPTLFALQRVAPDIPLYGPNIRICSAPYKRRKRTLSSLKKRFRGFLEKLKNGCIISVDKFPRTV